MLPNRAFTPDSDFRERVCRYPLARGPDLPLGAHLASKCTETSSGPISSVPVDHRNEIRDWITKASAPK
jgi:hypothetical protein